MLSRITATRRELIEAIEHAFTRDDSPFRNRELWSEDVARRLREYVLRGKMLRGALIPFSYSLFRPGDRIPRSCFDAGAAMELLQSFLLIHDDIMDQDLLRRGLPAVHAQYAEITPPSGDPEKTAPNRRGQYGLSMGICAGDVAAFMALHLLSVLPLEDRLRQSVLELATREIMIVGMAQMQDVHNGYVESVTPEEVLDVYTYKTGRYTFSLPLQLGAMMADVDGERQELLVRLGERLGRIFQVRDDLLGIMEEAVQTGKPVGSDITENKQTYYRALLFSRLPADDPVREFFGKRNITTDEIERLRSALEEYGIFTHIDDHLRRESEEAGREIAGLHLGFEEEEALRELLAYNLTRRS